MDLAPWMDQVQRASGRLLSRVSELVLAESPTHDPGAVNRALEVVLGWLRELGGGRLERHASPGSGDMLVARFGALDDPRPPVLLLGHLDTVWPLGTLARMPFRVQDGWAYGPGVLDMKAGVVMAVEALRLVAQADPRRPAILVLSADEETGSHHSRARIEALARGCRAVFVLEPGQGDAGAYKTERKGVGHYRLEIAGRAVHSGVDFAAGASAIRELAFQVEQLSAITDQPRGTTLNVGVVGGGTQPNVVAAQAWAEIDLRVRTLADAEQIDRRLRQLAPRDPHCQLRLTGGLNRPPMERTAATVALFEQARGLAAQLGCDLQEAATGGGSDGNFTSALGIPTLDGMGATGRGAHAENESIHTASLVLRTVLLAAMIARTI
jgi:glutamate carboxypeptidase